MFKTLATILVSCTILDAIQTLRPGALWTIQNGDYDALTWMDHSQTKPMLSELQTAIDSCISAQSKRQALKTQAKLDVKNSSLTQTQRLQALLILLDFDQ